MGKEFKIAFGVAVALVIGIVVAALVLQPEAEIWSKSQQARQLIGLGAAGVALTFVVASVERARRLRDPEPSSEPDQPRPE
jgi:hypothetical protein